MSQDFCPVHHSSKFQIPWPYYVLLIMANSLLLSKKKKHGVTRRLFWIPSMRFPNIIEILIRPITNIMPVRIAIQIKVGLITEANITQYVFSRVAIYVSSQSDDYYTIYYSGTLLQRPWWCEFIDSSPKIRISIIFFCSIVFLSI